MRPFEAGEPDARLFELLRRYPPEMFSQRFHVACRWTERYAEDWALDIARQLEVGRLARFAGPAEACEQLGLQPGFAPAMRWLLATLAAQGLFESQGTGADRCYRSTGPLPTGHRDTTRTAALTDRPEIAPTFDLMDAAGAIYPEVARGTKSGDAALFGLGQAGLWVRYFDNGNPVYAINNRVAAHHAAEALGRRPGPCRVIELGAGTGSATEALLAELERLGLLSRIASYLVSEPSSFFRRQAERKLPLRFPNVPISFAAVDMNLPFPPQGVAEASCDLIYSVNVLHVAQDLAATLTRIRGTIAPGGGLIAGECMRLDPDVPLAAEMVFQILEGFTRVETDPELRPEPGFLEPRHWRRSLEHGGFSDVELEPDHQAIGAFFPQFGVGVASAKVSGG